MYNYQLYLIILGLILTIIAFRQSLFGIYLRIYYGSYHQKYLNYFDKDSYFQAAYYSKGELSNQISNMKNVIRENDHFHVDQNVQFQGVNFGISTNDLVALKGKPVSSDILKIGDISVISLEYNIQDNNVIDKNIFYFYNDEYYFGEYIFNKIEGETHTIISDTINKKYGSHFCDEDQFVISNAQKNTLLYLDYGFRISVGYFNENSKQVHQLIQHQKYTRKKNKDIYVYEVNIQEIRF